jgi:hypothetical protein
MRDRGWMFATFTLMMLLGVTVAYGTYVHLQPAADAGEVPATIISAHPPTPDPSLVDNGASPEDPDVITAELIEDLQISLEETSRTYANLAGTPETP